MLAHDRRIRHGPLRRPPNTVVQRALVRVVPAVRVGQEERVDVAALEDLGQVDPVVEAAFCGGAIGGVLLLSV